MKKYKIFIGIDVSKSTLDVFILDGESTSVVYHQVFENNLKWIRQIIRFVKQHTKAVSTEWLFCLEHTGVYAMPLCCFLSEQGMNYALIAGMQIRKSIGIKRGKSDKADCKDIARYAYMHQQEIQCYQLPEKQLLKLKLLLSYRERLMKCRKMIETSKESELFLDKDLMGGIAKDSRSLVKTLQRKIKQVDNQIQELMKTDETLHRTYQLATSIPGVGMQIACHMIVCTRCFRSFDNARQLACYAGVAPFEYSSGTSIHGRNKVNHLANKKLKTLLNMGALTAIKLDRELSLYYKRKVNEGKNPMLVLNAVRNKLAARIFATVKRGTPYVPMMNYAA